MSRTQERAKSHVIPLFRGERSNLDSEAQEAISLWVAMASITSEHIARNPNRIAIPKTDRIIVMQGAVPPRWRIWFGTLRKTGWSRPWVHATFPISAAEDVPQFVSLDDRRPNAQTTTFAIGHLLVTVISTPFRSVTDQWDWRTAPQAAGRLRQICPITATPTEWHGHTITHLGADAISDAFVRYFDDLARRKGYA
jgi:hypothetical protein